MNIGCLFDIPTGTYLKGANGEHILCGGLPNISGNCGRGNTYKSTIQHFTHISILNRYACTDNLVYDTENSLTPQRIDALTEHFENLVGRDLDGEGRVRITDTDMMGNKWWDAIKAIGKQRVTNAKKLQMTTPFIDTHGAKIKITKPLLVEIDSMSQVPFDAVELMQDKAEVGESGRNMEAMKASGAKSQMIGEMPNFTKVSGIYLSMSAHLDDEIQLDPYAPPTKRLAFMKQKTIFKRVPKNFSFLTNILYSFSNANVLQNKSDKTPLFPRDEHDRMPGDVDLQVVTVQCLRSKNGASGGIHEVVVSQSEGVLVGLTEFYYAKTRKFGFGGNDRNYHLELYPEVSLSRTTIRGKIDEDPKLRRALEINSEICQIKHNWKRTHEYLVEPAELYKGLKERGYNWDVLLSDTRGYWMFEEEVTEDTKKFLSTMDLFNMYAGTYHPYWYDDHLKKLGIENTVKSKEK
jgi:hypothetical protein